MPVFNRQKHSRNLKLTKCIAGKMANNRLRPIVFTCQAAGGGKVRLTAVSLVSRVKLSRGGRERMQEVQR